MGMALVRISDDIEPSEQELLVNDIKRLLKAEFKPAILDVFLEHFYIRR